MTKEEIIDVIHKTIYQFFDVCGDNEDVPMSDKDKLLLEVNKTICNNLESCEDKIIDDHYWKGFHNGIRTEKFRAGKRESCEDAVSRKTIVEMLNAREQGSVMTFDHFIELLYKLPSVTPTQRWIPCSDRLPKIHNRCEKYLVTLEHGGTYVALFTECDGKHWWTYDDVVAWMPLPKPYVPDTNVGKMKETESESNE